MNHIDNHRERSTRSDQQLRGSRDPGGESPQPRKSFVWVSLSMVAEHIGNFQDFVIHMRHLRFIHVPDLLTSSSL